MEKKQTKQDDKFSSLITLFAVIIAVIFVLYDEGIISIPWLDRLNEATEIVSDGNVRVHFIDVGQGDCELIVADDGTAMLIDAGESEYGATVVKYITDLGITHLDYVIVTHPHSDHMGGMATVILSDLTIGKIIIPKIPDEFVPTTRTFEGFLDAVSDKGCKLTSAKTSTFELGSGTVTLFVTDYDGDNLNNYSVVTRFDFKDSSFLFTGDIEKKIEKKLLLAGCELDADVLKVAHHGSDTSSSKEFIKQVNPEICVIECGDHSYNHPHSDTVKLLKKYTEYIMRTDVNGNVIVTTDGNTIEYTTEK